jgi:hypothetical protein
MTTQGPDGASAAFGGLAMGTLQRVPDFRCFASTK